MDLPVEKLGAKMDTVHLPDTIYSLLIEKYFGQSSSAAVAQTSALEKPSLSYSTSRNWKGFVINDQCYYFTPTSWSLFSDQHITLESIKVFNVNHLYWLPGELLESSILKIPNLEELSIKGTQVCSVVQLAKILQSCPKIRKLEFTYTENNLEEIVDGLKKAQISFDLLTAGFQKLTVLKLSTTVQEPKHDVYKDPWLLIIKMLSYCRDCTDLAIEITYTGKILSQMDDLRESMTHLITEQRVKEDIERNELPKLAWMKKLKSLVLVKLGPGASLMAGPRVISILLDSLTCSYLFPHRGAKFTRPLEHLWIQGFEIHLCAAMKYSSPKNLQSYLSGDCDVKTEKYESFVNMKHLGGMMGLDFSRPLPSLKKLKYASGRFVVDDEFYKFCEAHSELVGLSAEYWLMLRSGHVNDALCKLPKLKSFSCQRLISKAFIEAMTEAYPILEILQLTTLIHMTIPPDHQAVLSAFRFPHLTFLSLCDFQLLDGTALLPIIKGCPKLQIVHLKTDSLDPASFPVNLEHFIRQAVNLQNFRLEWSHVDEVNPTTLFSFLKGLLIGSDHKEDVYSATFFSILKALLKGSVHLERVALIESGSGKLPNWNHPPEFADFLVGFVKEMTDMTCCCLAFNQLDPNLKKKIQQRVEKEIVTERPSLWFYLDRVIPEASDPGVPPIHYHQIVHPISYVMPRV